MANPLIAKINNAPLKSWGDALNILEITNDSPSVSEINKAFRSLVVKVHPDHNSDETKAANQACAKLLKVRDILIKGKDAFGQSLSEPPTSFDWFNAMFDKNSSYMKGPIVSEIRNILSSWAGILEFDLGTTPKKIKNFFEKMSFGDSDRANQDKQEILKHVDLFFPVCNTPSCAIAGQLAAEELDGIRLFLQRVVMRYPQFKESYQNFFKKQITEHLQQTKKSLFALIKRPDLKEKFEGKSLLKLSGFEEFSYAFMGIEKPPTNGLVSFNPEQSAVLLLNECVKEDPQLFSDLVNAANLLRELIDNDKLFLYSDTGLRLIDTAEAEGFNNLCNGFTQKEVLNAQLCHILQPILGTSCISDLSEALQKQFPKEKARIERRLIGIENGKAHYKATDVITKKESEEVYEGRQTRNVGVDAIKPVIPDPAVDSMCDFYIKNSSTSNTFQLNKDLLKTKSSILDCLEKTWIDVIKKQPVQQNKQVDSAQAQEKAVERPIISTGTNEPIMQDEVINDDSSLINYQGRFLNPPGRPYKEYSQEKIDLLQRINLFLSAVIALENCQKEGNKINKLELKNIYYDDSSKKSYIVSNEKAQNCLDEKGIVFALGNMMNGFFSDDIPEKPIKMLISRCMNENPAGRPTLGLIKDSLNIRKKYALSAKIREDLREAAKSKFSALTTREQVTQQLDIFKQNLEKTIRAEEKKEFFSFKEQTYQTIRTTSTKVIEKIAKERQNSIIIEEFISKITPPVLNTASTLEGINTLIRDWENAITEYIDKVQKDLELQVLAKLKEAYQNQLKTVNKAKEAATQKLQEKEKEIKETLIDYTTANSIEAVKIQQKAFESIIFDKNNETCKDKLEEINSKAELKIVQIISKGININFGEQCSLQAIEEQTANLNNRLMLDKNVSEDIINKVRNGIEQAAQNKREYINEEINKKLIEFEPNGPESLFQVKVETLKGELKNLTGEQYMAIVEDKSNRIKFLRSIEFYKHLAIFITKTEEFKGSNDAAYQRARNAGNKLTEDLKKAKENYLKGKTESKQLKQELIKAIEEAKPVFEEHRGCFKWLESWLYKLLQNGLFAQLGLFKTQSMKNLDAFKKACVDSIQDDPVIKVM